MSGEGRPDVVNGVRACRRAAGLKQQDLADAARVSLRVITLLENDTTYTPSVGIALKLAQALSCPVEKLFALTNVYDRGTQPE